MKDVYQAVMYAGSRRPAFVTGETYHVYNRGVEQRQLYLTDDDYLRFIHDLYEFNDINRTPACAYRLRRDAVNNSDVGHPNYPNRPKREALVDILVFCVMPNHFHLMLRQLVDGGITKFMQKLGTGYANYFNTKFKRTGALFQGKFKAKLLTRESHFLYLPQYIHFNALDLCGEKWREGKVRNVDAAIKFLAKYRWSSYPDYIGIKNYPSVTRRGLILDTFGGVEGYKVSVHNLLRDKAWERDDGICIDHEA